MLVPADEHALDQSRRRSDPLAPSGARTIVELDEVPRHRTYLSCSLNVSHKGMGGGKEHAMRVAATRYLYMWGESEDCCAMRTGGICGATLAFLSFNLPGSSGLTDPAALKRSQLYEMMR